MGDCVIDITREGFVYDTASLSALILTVML